MAIDDICPGAFAEPALITFWMIPGAVTVDWEADARRRWREMGLVTPIIELEQPDLADRVRAILERSGSMWAGWAAQMLAEGKAVLTSGPDPDAYTFSIGPPTLDNCPTCKGTGEVTDYPPDDDERTIACGTCGGTGEVWE